MNKKKLPIEINEQWADNEKGYSASCWLKPASVLCITVKNFMQIAGRFPLEDEQILIFSLRQFNTLSVIHAAVKTFGKLDELHITTYNINLRTIDSLNEDILNGHISEAHVYVSNIAKDHFLKSYERLNEVASLNPAFHVYYAWNHSKMAIFRAGNNYFVCEGSGNFSKNAQFEQFNLTNSKKIFEFRKNNLEVVMGYTQNLKRKK